MNNSYESVLTSNNEINSLLSNSNNSNNKDKLSIYLVNEMIESGFLKKNINIKNKEKLYNDLTNYINENKLNEQFKNDVKRNIRNYYINEKLNNLGI
jgi:hypothetical protein